jgi:3-hydroxymyristoyl/3-hydroxydecanoyl-(acyl carrier protein) dehydratase
MDKYCYVRSGLGEACLPIGQMLQIDWVLEVTPDSIHCATALENHWVFPLHFPADPIFPACLMIEAAGQAIAIWAWHHKMRGKPRLARVQASFLSEVRREDDALSIRARIRHRKNVCCGIAELWVGQRCVAQVEETLAWV